MMVSVVMSSATRVPGFSLALSTLVRMPTTYRGPLLAFTMTAAQPKRLVSTATCHMSHTLENISD